MRSPPRARSALVAALAACLFALIAGAKWETLHRYGSPMPDWDQWDAEGAHLLIPWIEGRDFLTQLVTPHNEHRVVLTKLQNLALYLVSGQWDARLQSVVNALLHTGLGVGMWLGARRCVGGAWQAALFVIVAALFAPPVAWENVRGGFHSQQYWLVSLSVVAVATLPFSPAGAPRWWAGLLAATLALGSMASGFLAAFTVLLVVGWRTARREVPWRAAWPTLAACATIVAIGLAIRVAPEGHSHMRAASVGGFLLSTLHSLEWPLRGAPWAGLILWLPWGVAAWRALAGRADRAGQVIAALGLWVIGQILAAAYARGAGGDYPSSRYMDTLAVGLFVNALALARLLPRVTLPRAARWALRTGAVAWLAIFGTGLVTHLASVARFDLPASRRYYDRAEANVAAYVATGDRRHLAGPDVPHPDPDALARWLDHPGIRAALPVPLRTSAEMSVPSYWAWQATTHGLLIAALAGGGALLLGAVAWRSARRAPR
ncbi:MAG: hypothetical protein JNL39_22295 [Opitutaceae bacterium]|nr:hypothetical protein [Opitutaceae bacterium]